MARRTKDITTYPTSDFYCVCCGLKNIPIVRKPGKAREPGHLKKLYCFHCNKENNMVEIKPNGKYTLENFLIEYNYHNFDENGNRKEPWKQFISKMQREMMTHEE